MIKTGYKLNKSKIDKRLNLLNELGIGIATIQENKDNTRKQIL